ncbi:beta-propeller fold lactonase family protein [Thalassotalea nanhaiensis]|uniref:Beta-propeller fold lactonase family protein n=1 Tax=Thalassotalea nanhaiensis TaxID=3065648 RepID=A0ABY9TJY1_9GAMM|nr:beta-propeller fold lactonase family protein [Colwelliaceae bacterium SQ345]
MMTPKTSGAFILLLASLFAPSLAAQEMLYLSSGDAIEVKKVNDQTGALTNVQKVELKGISVFTFSHNKKFLYARALINGKRKQNSIATYTVSDSGRLTLIHNAPIDGKTTELKSDASDQFIAGADYGKGAVSIWKLDNGVYKGELVQQVKLEQKAHAARFSPDNNMLFVPATGPNKIFQLSFDNATGKVEQIDPALGPQKGALQPRHLLFHPTLNVAYSTQERMQPGVAIWQVTAGGTLTLSQTLTNSDDTTGRITNADLHMSPDNKFLYISSRDQQKQFDQIIAYKIHPTSGQLILVEKFASEHFPRSFTINKRGDFLYVAGQKEDKLGVYQRDKETGHLTKVEQYNTGKNPIWVETLILESKEKQ